MIKKFRTLINDLIVAIISNLPGILGRKIRYFYWSRRFMSCGKNVIIDVGVIIQNPENIRVGNNVWIDKYVILIAGALST
ncbi:MAG: hypothetical protein N3E37_06025, partial [Candidatus Micrarchaeota archaeon]|nr:hypothetical protein [Candidatus Micrarchaeota archaeon]